MMVSSRKRLAWEERVVRAARVVAAACCCVLFLAGVARSQTVVSDDFHSSELDTAVWRLVDPVGDSVPVMTGTNLAMWIGGGVMHDMLSTGNYTTRLMQYAADTDIEIEAKFDSKGSRMFQGQGLIFQQDADTYIRFDIIFTSTVVRVFAAYFDAGVLTVKRDLTVPGAPPYLRVNRTGSTWTYRYSYDGSTWLLAKQFTQALTLTEVGVFFLNAASAGDFWATPAFTGNIDYFFNTNAPIVPEDGGLPSAVTPPVVEVWYGLDQAFGQHGVPQEWVNIQGRVWDTEAVDTLYYSLNGGAGSGLTIGPDGKRLVGVGDYNIEIRYEDLAAGVNGVVITAVDTLGERRDTTVTVDYTPGVTWAMPYTAAFETATSLFDAAHVVDGRWYLVPGEGVRVDSSATGYDRLIVIGDETWETNYEVLVPFTIHAASLGTPSGVGIGLGWQGHIGSRQPRLEAPFQTITWVKNFPADPTLFLQDDDDNKVSMSVPVLGNVRYLMRTRSQSLGNGISLLRTRLWEDGTIEPAEWNLEMEMQTFNGSMLLIAHRSIATFGNVQITPVSSLEPRVVTVNIVGQGTVTRTPDKPSYQDGEIVVLTAIPDSASVFGGWSGDHSSEENPDTIVVLGNTTITATFSDVVAGIESPSAPPSVTLAQNRPNPFRRDTVFDIGLPSTAEVEIEVYDVAGRRVFADRLGVKSEGWHRYRFDGTDAGRRPLPSGVYFYRLKTSGADLTRKMVILR